MKIENQQELEKLIKLLRKTGVEALKLAEFEIKLGSDVPVSTYKRKKQDKQHKDFPEGKPSNEEELLFWSSTPPGVPEPPEV